MTHLNTRGSLERKWISWIKEPNEFEWVQDLRELSRFCDLKGVTFDRSDQNGTVRRLYEKLQEDVIRKESNVSEESLWKSLTNPVIEKSFLLLKMKPFHPLSSPPSEYPAVDGANPFAIHRTLTSVSFDDKAEKETKDKETLEKSISFSLLDRLPPTPSPRTGRIQKSFTDFPETEQAKAMRNRQIRSQHIDQVCSNRCFFFLSLTILPLLLRHSHEEPLSFARG